MTGKCEEFILFKSNQPLYRSIQFSIGSLNGVLTIYGFVVGRQKRFFFFMFIFFFRGVLREGDQLLLGPFTDGCFQPITVTSVKRNRAPCRVVRAGQAASVALSGIDRSLLRRVRLSSQSAITKVWKILYLT